MTVLPTCCCCNKENKCCVVDSCFVVVALCIFGLFVIFCVGMPMMIVSTVLEDKDLASTLFSISMVLMLVPMGCGFLCLICFSYSECD